MRQEIVTIVNYTFSVTLTLINIQENCYRVIIKCNNRSVCGDDSSIIILSSVYLIFLLVYFIHAPLFQRFCVVQDHLGFEMVCHICYI